MTQPRLRCRLLSYCFEDSLLSFHEAGDIFDCHLSNAQHMADGMLLVLHTPVSEARIHAITKLSQCLTCWYSYHGDCQISIKQPPCAHEYSTSRPRSD